MAKNKSKQKFIDSPEGWALLVIDVQIGLFKKSTPICHASELLSNINYLVDTAHQKNIPVFFIQHSNEIALVYGTKDWQLHPNLKCSDNDYYIHKLQGNAFEGTNLEELLDSKSVNHLVITGLVTHGCVKTTCMGALDKGYKVTLVEDGHSNYSKDATDLIHKWNQKLREKGVKIIKTQKIGY